jgi:hypothetical protein
MAAAIVGGVSSMMVVDDTVAAGFGQYLGHSQRVVKL